VSQESTGVSEVVATRGRKPACDRASIAGRGWRDSAAAAATLEVLQALWDPHRPYFSPLTASAAIQLFGGNRQLARPSTSRGVRMTITNSPFTEPVDAVFAAHNRTLDRPTTIQHWQLRDLVSCPGRGEALFTVHDACTIRHCLHTGHNSVVQNLSFKPTSMTVNGEYIAAGGQQKQLDVRHLASGATLFKDTVGGSVNNALHLARDASGEMRLFVCNNDESIRIFSLPRMTVAHHIQGIPAPVNYASMSPDGNHLAFVGDCELVFVYKATPSGYQRLTTVSEAEDSGMCCDWNAAGTCVAAAAQDGTLCVWDIRSGRTVAKYGARSPFRAVKFSSGPADLLTFTEHDTAAHLVDSRMYGMEQVINVASPEMEADISGVTFAPDGSKLYVGTCDGINEYSVDMRRRCSFQSGSLI